jgi:hypothetical protein
VSQVAAHTAAAGYEDAAGLSLGAPGLYLASFCSALQAVGVMCAAMSLVAGTVPSALVRLAGLEGGSTVLGQPGFVLGAVCAVFVAPAALMLRRARALRVVAAASVALCVATVGVMIDAYAVGDGGSSRPADLSYAGGFVGVLRALPFISLGLASQAHNLWHVLYACLTDPTGPRAAAVVAGSVVTNTVLVVLAGTFGYLTMRGVADSEDINILNGRGDTATLDAARLCLGAACVLACPLALAPGSKSLRCMLFGDGTVVTRGLLGGWLNDTTDHVARRVLVDLAVIFVCFGLCALVEGFPGPGIILAIVGTATGPMLTLVLPALMYVRVCPGSRWSAYRVLAIVTMVSGIAVTVGGVAGIVARERETY